MRSLAWLALLLVSSPALGQSSSMPCRPGEAVIGETRGWVGSPHGDCPDETRLPSVAAHVREMCIDLEQVTVADYAACEQAGACAARAALDLCASAPGEPVDCVRWEDARAYCRFAGAALPSEAQLDAALHTDAPRSATDEARPLPEGLDLFELAALEWTLTSATEERPYLPPARGRDTDRIARRSSGDEGEAVPATLARPRLGFRCRRESPVRWSPPPGWASAALELAPGETRIVAYQTITSRDGVVEVRRASLGPDLETRVPTDGRRVLVVVAADGTAALALLDGDGSIVEVVPLP